MFAPENQWLDDVFPFKKAYFQVNVSFREGISAYREWGKCCKMVLDN